MYAIDLFAGAGGMSVGARQAGLHVAYSVEIDARAALTYRHNHPNTILLNRDIATVVGDDLKDKPGRHVDFLFGGPPCQGFSTSNQRTRSSTNPANWLFREYVRLVSEIMPRWLIFENVKGLIETERGFFLRAVRESIEKLGYTVTTFVLDAVDYGVPQRRKRLFLIGSQEGHVVSKPLERREQKITVRNAIADLPSLMVGASEDFLPYKGGPHSSYAKEMRCGLCESGNHLVTNNSLAIVRRYTHIPQGGNWEDIPARLMRNYSDRTRSHTGLYHRLQEDEPSIVVGNYRKNMLIHPWEHRGLSVRESARLQSFPDNYRFFGSIGFQQQQVGNAVPPLLAKHLFMHIMDNFSKAGTRP